MFRLLELSVILFLTPFMVLTTDQFILQAKEADEM